MHWGFWMPRIAQLIPSEVAVLSALADYDYLTQAQLATVTALASSVISDLLKRLRLVDLVKDLAWLRPAAYRLTGRGARLVGAPAPRERAYPAIQHSVHRAQALLQLRAEFPGAQLLSRHALCARGLYPSPGEHAAQSNAGWVFFLVDDYLMRPARLEASWTRRHTPLGHRVDIAQLRAEGDYLLQRWCDAAQAYRVFTTDERQVSRLEQAAARAGVPAQVAWMKPLWRLSR